MGPAAEAGGSGRVGFWRLGGVVTTGEQGREGIEWDGDGVGGSSSSSSNSNTSLLSAKVTCLGSPGIIDRGWWW